MHHKATAFLEEHNMLERGSRVIVGFSGGADSVALLHFLLSLGEEWQLQIVVCHVNHQLRGEESLRDESFCRFFCEERGLELHVFREDVSAGAKAVGKSVEEYGREVRYRCFEQLLHSEKDRIATAHHANDLAETILFHLARGTGLKGLAGIPARRGNIIRPLLTCSRQEIEAYCREHSLSYVTDSSNLSDQYSRNHIRHQVIPPLEEINPAFLESILRLSKQAALEEDYLEAEACRSMEESKIGETLWNRAAFSKLHPALQKRIAAKWLDLVQAERSEKKITDLLSIIKEGGTLELRKGHYLKAEGEKIHLFQQEEVGSYFQFPFQLGETELFPGKKLLITEISPDKFEFFANNGAEYLKNALDYDKMVGVPMLRQRLPGDKIRLRGREYTSTFKNLLNHRGLSLAERSRLAVLADEKGPLWLEGFGVRWDAVPDENSRCALLLRVEEEQKR